MGRVALDLKKFKHIKSDKNSVTLQHTDGHQLTLAKHKLGPEFKAQLDALSSNSKESKEKMAEGGQPQPSPSSGPDMSEYRKKVEGTSGQRTNRDAPVKSVGEAIDRLNPFKAEGGKIPQKMAEGGEAQLPCLNPNCKSHGQPHPNCRCHPGMAEGGEVIHFCRTGKNHATGCAYAKGGEVSDAEPFSKEDEKVIDDAINEDVGDQERQTNDYGRMVSGQESREMPTPDEVVQTQPQQPQVQPQMQAAPGVAQMQPQIPQGQPAQPLEMQQAAGLPQNQPYQQQPTLQPSPTQEPERNPSPSEQEHAEDQAWAHDLANGHITPKTYGDLWKDKSTPSKIAGLFGLIIGGIGSGLTHQPNAALQMMDNVIKNDLEAQKQSKSNAQNHWHLNYQHALMEAQANGMDASSEHTREQAKALADTRTHMQANRAAYQQLVDMTAKIPDNDPRKVQFLKAIATIGAQVDNQNANLVDKYQMQNTLINDKHGIPKDSTISRPKGDAVKPKKEEKKSVVDEARDAFKKGSEKNEAPTKYSILDPSSERKYRNVMNGYDPQWSPKSDLVNQQYTQAQQAEKILNGPKGDGKGGIHDIMQEMYKAQNNMGVYGHLHNKVQEMGAALPFIGGAAGAATQLVPNTESEKKYNALKTTLESDLGTALQGLMTPTDIHSAVEKFAPAYQDEPKDIKFKQEQLANVVQKALRTSVLGSAGFLKKQK